MARKTTPPDRAEARHRLASRLRAVRVERYGERGGPELAGRLGVPARSWYNYELGVTVPAEVLLRFLEVTGAEPCWLLDGRGPRYRADDPPRREDEATAPDGIGAAAMESLLEGMLRLLARGELRIRWVPDDDALGPG